VGNPLYGAGIGCLGEGLQVEAVCEDGQIEAVSVKGAKVLAVGVVSSGISLLGEGRLQRTDWGVS